MAVYYNLQDIPVFHNPVVTIGSFDGVHHGHKAILSEVVRVAEEVGGESILITFEPHPRKIIHPDQLLGLLTSTEQKIRLIEAEGIHHIVVVPFTRDFSMMSAGAYINDFLLKNFHPHTIIMGYDHRFGHSREGNIHMLERVVSPQVSVREIPAQLIENAAVSSTKIRNALLEGRVRDAGEMLERWYSIEAMVVHGEKIGRTIGYPTANLQPLFKDILIPGKGVYAVMVDYKGILHKGMMSIGNRPTVTDDKEIKLEVNILDFNEDLYGQYLTVYFADFLRGEEKLESLEALKQKIAQDERDARRVLADWHMEFC